ncbi:MAG: acyl-CoA thioesterase [Gammaproteobacteria bacterium]|nr:acyl-CoA thioesterase [Gammaproteobacteria bacterium]
MGKSFRLQMKVRDYECDMQGIVNNAVYQNYLEFARHEYLESRGVSFAELTKLGVIIAMVRAEIDYKRSLKAGDEFTVSVMASRPSRIRLQFEQEIRRAASDELMLKAVITTTAVNERNRPYFPAVLENIME